MNLLWECMYGFPPFGVLNDVGIYGGIRELKTGCDAVSGFRKISVTLHSPGFMALGYCSVYKTCLSKKRRGMLYCD